MPSYYRRSYRSRYRYRRRPRRYVRKWFKRRMRRFVNGSSKSSVRVKVPISATQSLQVPSTGTVIASPVCPWRRSLSAFSVLNSPLYLQYCQLYDEVKCIGAKVVVTVGTPIGTATIPSLELVTAWDRRCGTNEAAPTYGELKNFGSQQTAVAVNNSIAKILRSCYASDLLEKAQWHDCTVEVGAPYSDPAYAAAGNNPNFFVPGMWIGLSQGNTAAAQTITLQFEIRYYFTFRNPKYGASASSKGDGVVLAKSMDSSVGVGVAAPAPAAPVARRRAPASDAAPPDGFEWPRPKRPAFDESTLSTLQAMLDSFRNMDGQDHDDGDGMNEEDGDADA